MVSLEQYFGSKPHSDQFTANATALLDKVNKLLAIDLPFPIDPDTGSQISGARGGAGDGGFRLPSSTTGAPNSKHRSAHAVDIYDPEGQLDNYLNDRLLTLYGLFRESPDFSFGWCHLQDVAPRSGRRTFIP